jgi:hypothetical protein
VAERELGLIEKAPRLETNRIISEYRMKYVSVIDLMSRKEGILNMIPLYKGNLNDMRIKSYLKQKCVIVPRY